VSGAENGAERVKKSDERSEAVSGLNLPLMALKPVVLCTVCTLHSAVV